MGEEVDRELIISFLVILLFLFLFLHDFIILLFSFHRKKGDCLLLSRLLSSTLLGLGLLFLVFFFILLLEFVSHGYTNNIKGIL